MKPRVKCGSVSIRLWNGGPYWVAYLNRLSDHPSLGPPRAERQSRTSALIRADFEKKELETLNTIYWWE